jgi:hypothetical protein
VLTGKAFYYVGVRYKKSFQHYCQQVLKTNFINENSMIKLISDKNYPVEGLGE